MRVNNAHNVRKGFGGETRSEGQTTTTSNVVLNTYSKAVIDSLPLDGQEMVVPMFLEFPMFDIPGGEVRAALYGRDTLSETFGQIVPMNCSCKACVYSLDSLRTISRHRVVARVGRFDELQPLVVALIGGLRAAG